MVEIASEKFVKISWGALVFIAAVIIAILGWQASTELKVQAAELKASDAISRLDRQKDSIEKMRDNINDTRDRTIRIEAVVNEMNKKL